MTLKMSRGEKKTPTSQVRNAKAITLREPHAEGWLLKGGLNALDQSAVWIKGLWDLITCVLKNGPANVTLSQKCNHSNQIQKQYENYSFGDASQMY